MAAVDKIYGTQAQYRELKEWCTKHCNFVLVYFYSEIEDASKVGCITNFPMWVDKWLLENCTIGWVCERIREQYDLKEGKYIDDVDFYNFDEHTLYNLLNHYAGKEIEQCQ